MFGGGGSGWCTGTVETEDGEVVLYGSVAHVLTDVAVASED